MIAFGIDWYIIGCYRFPIWWIGKQPWCLIFTINYIFPCTGKNRVVFTLKKNINGKLNLVNGRLVNSSWELAHLKLAIQMRSKIETTVKKDTTCYSVLTQDIKRKVFWRRYQISNKISLVFRV
jgi:hypothetical protein